MNSNTSRRRLLSVNEAAEYLGIHHRTVRRKIHQGLIKAHRLPGSRTIRIDLDELDRALEGGAA